MSFHCILVAVAVCVLGVVALVSDWLGLEVARAATRLPDGPAVARCGGMARANTP